MMQRQLFRTKKYLWEWRTEDTSINIEPYKPIRVCIISDLHIPFHDKQAIKLALIVSKDAHPDILILAGDVIDFYAISKFDRSPERRLKLSEEISETKRIVGHLYNELQVCKPSVWIWMEGNHESRLRQFLWRKAMELTGLEELHPRSLFGISQFKNFVYLERQVYPQQARRDVVPCVKVGSLFILHGDKISTTGLSVNAPLNVFRRLLVNTLIGHYHRADHYVQCDYEGRPKGCWINPCLCLPRPHYDAGRVWIQGISIVEVNVDGFFRVEIIPFLRTNGKLVAFWHNKEYHVREGQ